MASASLTFTRDRVAEVLGKLADMFTMIDFLSVYDGSFISDGGEDPGRSANVANAKAAARALRIAGCSKAGDQSDTDDTGHPTTTSVWAKAWRTCASSEDHRPSFPRHGRWRPR